MTISTTSVAASGTFRIGGDLPVHRLGFGAMRITGPGVWGPPANHDEAIRVLRRAVELGVTLIDTADAYGPNVSEELIAEALHPYPADLVIATKGGFQRSGPNKWTENGDPAYLRAACDASLARLKLDRIDLYQLHRVDPHVPADDQFAVLAELRQAGKVRHVGLSQVSVEQIEAARKHLPIVSVQNRYNLVDRKSEDVLDYCEREGIGFIPWNPLNVGKLPADGGALAEIAKHHTATPAQIALAWLLRRSPVMLPIPGTSTVAHLEENLAAAGITLTDDEYGRLDAMASA
jgi:aryl-alcohol dehydrogenase-like predicted oxidoreductase